MTTTIEITAILDVVRNSEPLTPLTAAEIEFILTTVLPLSRDEVLAKLKNDIQIACEIELATIPVYLYTYYSILRSQSTGENISPEVLFANKAGASIMSVAVEEMLHMSLSANLYFSMFGESPSLYGHSATNYPTPLPYHNPTGPEGPEGEADAAVLIPLGKLAYEQLWHFLQIEYPESREATPKDRNWDTIGQFYSYIRCMLCSPQLRDSDFKVGGADYQIQPYNYAPNNIDTVNPKSTFNPWNPPNKDDSAAGVANFSNEPDSHAGPTQLMTVSCRLDAMLAIDTICDQGEGFNHTAFDDPSDMEASHFYKFLSLQAQFEQYKNHTETLPDLPTPPAAITPTMHEKALGKLGLIFNFPTNPKTANYITPAETAMSDFCNGLYQYMLIMTETLFKVRAEPDLAEEKQSQKWYFNVALHRSMIWVLDKFVQTMRKVDLVDAKGCPTGEVLAPTFEFINLGTPNEAFDSLKSLGNKAIIATKDESYGGNVEYYVNIAVNKMAGKESMHLPNVADFI